MDKFLKAIKEIREIREANEKREKEEEMDKWFESLNIFEKVDLAYILWDGLSFEDKKEEYEKRR